MPRINELKKGDVVEVNGLPHIVKTYEVRNPSSRGASTMYKVRFNNLKTGIKVDETFKGEDVIKELDCPKVAVRSARKRPLLTGWRSTDRRLGRLRAY